MKLTLKPIAEQVVVVVGASSGIGLVTATRAAAQGARVVLAARNGHDLERAVEGIRRRGGRAVFVVADVADPDQVDAIANAAVADFGRIDTWVNNAAVSMYGRVMEITLADLRRQLDVNFWGVVHGCRTAVPHLARRGGALINVASVLADRAIPLQGMYCAAKHAMKAFTDTLRMELEADGAPISVTLVKPGSTDTPFFQKARTYLNREPRPVPPAHTPDVVAHAILACATQPERDIIVGGPGKLTSVLATVAPRLTDYYMERTLFENQQSDRPLAPGRRDNLYEPVVNDGGERGQVEGLVMKRSLFTHAALHPLQATFLVGALGLAVASVAGLTTGLYESQ